ncbi:ADP-ribose pyrophosphatase [Rhodobacter sp. TJ_12]|uniref:NUDIX hydrolase n=1 Tax=Rhodobacter sp. TJ_12 TaxID=2029399 RepID=UPI001CBBEDF9|nr:NUDIX hydrolase [Rhodobacter sp. TJ_12]MBZ4023072.1 ADP-ribose pyrophosphatase [Rhodobacter sp. TJ_12]
MSANCDTAPAALAPRVAVIATVVRGDHVLLVRRANPPDAGKWGFPGGKVDLGEPLDHAALRELREETGIEARADRVFAALDAFDYDDSGVLRYHYVLVAVLCSWVTGTPVAGDDALEARWVALSALESGVLPLSRDVLTVAQQGAALAAQRLG